MHLLRGLLWCIPICICLNGAIAAQDSVVAARPPQRVLLGVTEAVGFNVLLNRFDALVMKEDWARAGTRTWSRNLREGWEWDEDAFGVNMFSHPYHGSLYFNAARSNGVGYWDAAPVAFLGSWTWEYFGETYRPSLNDFFMTSFGGITLGEVFHRIGASIRDNRATGSGRLGRELAALPFDPMGGFNRLIRGEWKRIGPNPAEHAPDAWMFRSHVGVRFTGEAGLDDSAARSGTMITDLQYGDPFLTPFQSPFDAFSVRIQVSTAEGLSQLRGSGRLYSKAIRDTSAGHHHAFAVNQRYDYIKNPSQSFGAQSFEAGLLSRWTMPLDFRLRSQLFGSAIALGAIDAPDAGSGERAYDFGPGLGLRLELSLERRGIIWLTLWARNEYLHSVSGASADHMANFGGFELVVPVWRGLGLGLHTGYFDRESHSSDAPDDQRQIVELRVILALTSAGRLTPVQGSIR
jgi:hypothetical protein